MFATPRLNWFLFGLFALITLGLFAASLLSPAVRAVAPAPLRDLLLPPPKPILISVLYSTEKVGWLTEAAAAFEATRPLVNGRLVQVQLEKMGSRELYLAVLDGTKRPHIISPASALQIAILQDQSTQVFGRPIVSLADQQSCRPVVTTPLVLVAWEERARVLWGTTPGPRLWRDLQAALVNPAGWGAFGHPEWGYVKFGHTDPLRSNSGFMTILLMAYDYHGKTSGLTAADVMSDPGFQKWFLDFERSISQFEYSTGPLMEKMIAYGPSLYDIVAVYEATAIEQAENAVGRYGELRVYYPPVTVWSDHPFCILNTDWVTPEQAQAAQMFINFLLQPEMQQLALLKYGFRPVNPSVPLNQPGSPFVNYVANGFRLDLSDLPVVQPPSGEVLNLLLEFWSRNVTR